MRTSFGAHGVCLGDDSSKAQQTLGHPAKFEGILDGGGFLHYADGLTLRVQPEVGVDSIEGAGELSRNELLQFRAGATASEVRERLGEPYRTLPHPDYAAYPLEEGETIDYYMLADVRFVAHFQSGILQSLDFSG